MKTFQSTPITFIDQTDSRKLEVYITSNLPTVQIYNQNKSASEAYTPDWTEGENLVLSVDVFLDSRQMTVSEYNGTAIKWYKNNVKMSDGSIEDISDDKRKITIKDNILKDNAIITYTCEAEYQGIKASTRVTFTRVDTGLNGAKGADGTSVRILGNAKSVSPVENTSYYTITYDASAVVAAALGDAYVYNGELYVCSVLNGGTDGVTDYFVNVGPIKGDPGDPAKTITLIGSSQVFRVDKDGKTITPSTIIVTAHPVNIDNTSEIDWAYRYNATGAWTGITNKSSDEVISLSNNVAVINSTKLNTDTTSIILKATYEEAEDVFTVYKAFDGVQGNPAPIAFLTNENISFVADYNGVTPMAQSVITKVVAYIGDEKVVPQIGDLSVANAGLNAIGMNIEKDEIVTAQSDKEIALKISVQKGVNLGSALNIRDSFAIPIVYPISAPLSLNWSKINAGTPGEAGVGINSVQVTYGTTDSATTQPSSEDEWLTEIPIVPEGHYLWTRTIIDYTDSDKADTVTYTYAKQGEQGVPGSSITVSSIQYKADSSATAPPSTGWSDTVVATSAATPYLWTKTTFSDNNVAYSVARYGKDGVAGADAYTVLLTNESHVFAGTVSSAVASNATTQILAYKGISAQSVTIVSINGVAASTASTATGIAGLSFACSALSGTSPTITFTCTTAFVSPNGTIPIVIKVGSISITKMFTYSIAFKGATGGTGSVGPASSSYWLVSNASAVQKTSSGDILCTPATLTFTGRIQTGTSAPANYAGRWILAYSTDGSTYIDSYTSTANEVTASIATSATYKAVRARMYLAGGTTTLLDEQIIPFVSDGETGAPGATGDNAVTFQVYSNNGYALSTSVPTITLQTFAYIGDIEIKSGATYQWYRHNNTDWVAVSGATNAYFNISRDDVSFSNNYMCKMQFNGTEYVGVVTIEDKNDENRVFASKPSNYFAGDLWIVGTDYIPGSYTIGTMLRAEHTNIAYTDSDWVPATKYDEEIEDLKTTVESYKQYFSVNSTNGLQIGNSSINNDVLTTNRVEASIINSDVANVETINVTGRYSGSTMLQAPILNLGNFSFVIEGNGSLSIVANT